MPRWAFSRPLFFWRLVARAKGPARSGAAGAMGNAPAQRGADRPRVGAVPVRGDAVGGHAGGGPRRTEEGLRRRHVAVLAEHGVGQVAVPVDGAVEIAPPAPHLQVCLVHVPVPAAGPTLAVPTSPELAGQDRRE